MVSSAGRISKNLETGLVGYWPMDEGSGSAAHDASGNNNTGTITIGASGTQTTVSQAWTNGIPGRVGNSLNFDGTDDYVDSISKSPYLSVSNWTLAAWIKLTTPATTLAVYNGNNCAGYGFGVIGSELYGLFGCVAWIDGLQSISTGQWFYVVMTRDNLTTRFYINGTSTSATSTLTPIIPASQFSIAAMYYGGPPSYFFPGRIDDVRIYSRALSATEVQNLYNSY
jgi:hypothetical protein